MLKQIISAIPLGVILSFSPKLVIAGGGKTEQLIVVADTRMLTGINFYFANLYNEDVLIFAVWSVLITSILGVVLGLTMDVIMKLTGIDLTNRSLIEH